MRIHPQRKLKCQVVPLVFVPVRRVDPQNSKVNQYRRLSASQVIAWKNCPRLWYYGWIERMKSPLPPQIIRGNAVEECVCRVLRESPVLISSDSKSTMRSPLSEDGSPDIENQDLWIGPTLPTLPESSWPIDRDSLSSWASSRVEAHFDKCWDSAVKSWKSSSNTVGSEEDIDPMEGREMVEAALRMHLDQVESCFVSGGGPGLESWRGGSRQDWPSPDGFPRFWNKPHPSAGSGRISWPEAWEVARPWFVDPDAEPFTQTSAHPEDWFQGEYDLVYRWTGSPRIVDLKASIGKGDRSGGYLKQLSMYGWLWWETHDREEQVEALEIWYLGSESVKKVPKLNKEEMLNLNSELNELYRKIHANEPRLEDCPTTPSPLHFFDEGGVPSDPPTHPDKRARCTYCDYRGFCEGSNHEIELPNENRIERFGHSWPITSLSEIKTRSSIAGNVVGLKGPELMADGSINLEFTLQDGYDRARVKPSRRNLPKSVTRSISEGSRIIVENGMASIWRGQLQVELDDTSSIRLANEDEIFPIVEIETRVNVVARVWSIDAFPNGVDVHRWAVTIIDESGSAVSIAFKQFIPISAAAITRGDDIAILNGEIGEWAGRPQVRLGPGSRLVILRHADDNPDF